MNDKLPSIRDCTVSDCRYNDRWYCRTPKISVGKFDVPVCNAYEKSELPEPASGDPITRVISCEIYRCLRNRDMKCTAYAIKVRIKEGAPHCQSFKNRYK